MAVFHCQLFKKKWPILSGKMADNGAMGAAKCYWNKKQSFNFKKRKATSDTKEEGQKQRV